MSDRDYYEVLGLTPRADGTMVDQAYWHLARKYQSLAATNAQGEGLLDELNEAYGVLGNAVLRRQYDAFRDDVLIQQGMLKPVASKPKRQKPVQQAAPSEASAPFEFPQIHLENWRWYALASIVTGLALAGAWQGVTFTLVAPVLAVGLLISLTPVLKAKVSEVNIRVPSMSMPEMPRLSMPSMPNMPSMPSLSDSPGLQLGTKDDPMDADELRASTAQTISRWRQSVGLRDKGATGLSGLIGGSDQVAPEPDTTLVEIVESERDLDEASEPLNAVLDILRGSRRTIETP